MGKGLTQQVDIVTAIPPVSRVKTLFELFTDRLELGRHLPDKLHPISRDVSVASTARVKVLRGEYAERRKKYDIIFRFSLKMVYNIVLNGISLNILWNMILYSIWASPRNIHIHIPHVGLG